MDHVLFTIHLEINRILIANFRLRKYEAVLGYCILGVIQTYFSDDKKQTGIRSYTERFAYAICV